MGTRALLSRKLSLVALILLASGALSLPLFLLSFASATEPKTLAVTTNELRMTGLGGGTVEVKMTSGALQMTGLGGGTAEVKMTSGALQMTGLGGGTAVSMTTAELLMTGFGL
jgi:hypothetical protein